MMKRILTAVILLLVLVGLVWFGFLRDTTDNGPTKQSSVPVLAQKAQTRDVPVILHNVGTIQAYRTVVVKPQVDGKLLQLNFEEGQRVHKGQLLAKIDPVLYQASLKKAQAQLAMDQATLDKAQKNLKRYKKLAKTNYISQQTLGKTKAEVRAGKARLESDQAAITSARAKLGYTTVAAPITGRTGIRKVDVGNILDTSDGIVVITQLQPITVLFALPAKSISRVRSAAANGPVKVTVKGASAEQVLDTGSLAVINNMVDSATGTIKLKARLPNADEQLWPGQFVNVQLWVGTLKNATVVPVAAVQQGPKGAFVYGIDEHGKAVMKPIKVRQQNEHWAVIAKGVTPGQLVITAGFGRLSDGVKVKLDGQSQVKSGAAGQATGTGNAKAGNKAKQTQATPDAGLSGTKNSKANKT